eukprot:Clim_evm15s158 gene=Clim_evmTU15s158
MGGMMSFQRGTRFVRLQRKALELRGNIPEQQIPALMDELNNTFRVKMTTDAMVPNIGKGDVLHARKTEDVEAFYPGDVIVHKDPDNLKEIHVRRIVAGPGDELISTEDQNAEIKLGEGEYWVFADAGMDNVDSRMFGALKKDLLMGRAVQFVNQEEFVVNSETARNEDEDAGLLSYGAVKAYIDAIRAEAQRFKQNSPKDSSSSGQSEDKKE